MEFEYKINVMNDFLVITFKGKITREDKEKWQTCYQECQSHNGKNVVVVLKDVSSIDHSMSRDFALFQQEVRKVSKSFYLMGLKLQLKQDLDSRGLVRIHELKNSLDEILARAA